MKTKSGRRARVICRDRKGFGCRLPFLVLIEDDAGNEIAVPMSGDLVCKQNHNFPDEDLTIEEG